MFKTEQSLVDLLKKKIKKGGLPLQLNDRKMRKVVLDEVDLGYGVADLVVTHTKAKPRFRPSLAKVDIGILNCIERYLNIAIEEISRITGVSIKQVTESIEKLEERSLVRVGKNNQVSIKKGYQCAICETVAIEAKLSNWKRALKQAYRYHWFANLSLVCIPEDKVKPAVGGLDQFKKLNVGLLTLNQQGEIKLVFAPKVSQPIDIDMHMLLNERVTSSPDAS